MCPRNSKHGYQPFQRRSGSARHTYGISPSFLAHRLTNFATWNYTIFHDGKQVDFIRREITIWGSWISDHCGACYDLTGFQPLADSALREMPQDPSQRGGCLSQSLQYTSV